MGPMPTTSSRNLALLFFCVFLVMAGYGITLPVFPFYTERIASMGGISNHGLALQVGLLTSVYVFMQFVSAPFWGSQSDRLGRKPLILIGVAGYAIGQVFYGLSTSLPMLYSFRVLGGLFSAALLPAATSYVADVTEEKRRTSGMAWLGAMTSLGVIVGPSLDTLLSRTGLRFSLRYGGLLIDHFSVPFLAAGGLALVSLPLAIRGLDETYHPSTQALPKQKRVQSWRAAAKTTLPLLALLWISQYGLTTFAATFALYAQRKLSYGPARVGVAFTVCGLVMAIVQVGVVKLSKYDHGEHALIASGFGLMGVGLIFLLLTQDFTWILGAIAVMALGQALIAPNLLSSISKVGSEHKGAALGLADAAGSLGQTVGPLVGTVLFSWKAESPFWLTGLLLIVVALTSSRLRVEK